MDPKEELNMLNSELNAIEIQLQQLLERQQHLLSKKKKLEEQVFGEKKLNENVKVRSSDPKVWSTFDFPWSKEMEESKKSVFRISKFRPYQVETMNVTMSGVDCILVMPTGGGKSLCFQMPAVISSGITLVISPLVSLMEDQLMSLQELNITSALLNANSSKEDVNEVHKAMIDKQSNLKILYVTPEKIAKSKRFMAKLEKSFQAKRLSRIVIDEVHCASQWGHDFRPDYKILGILKRQFPDVPILGLTATATLKVVEDLKTMLGLNDQCVIFKASFNRANLYYEVVSKPSSHKVCMDNICSVIKQRFSGESGIIYCFSRKDAEQVAQDLISRGLSAACYHAYMTGESRSQVHKAWIKNKIKVVVATVAFGMGIDKPNVRFVIHHSLSKSMENYYQESGRAGRDDSKSYCILFYRPFDVFRQSTMVFTERTGLENLYGMVTYCQQQATCRRTQIGRHFGERWDPSKCDRMCDYCSLKTAETVKNKDITDYAQSLIRILNHAADISERVTPSKLIDAWKGRGQPSLRVPNMPQPQLTLEECERVVVCLLLEEVLKEEFHFTPFSTISYLVPGPRASSVLKGLKVKMLVNFAGGTSKELDSKKIKASKKKSNKVEQKDGTCFSINSEKPKCVKRKIDAYNTDCSSSEDELLSRRSLNSSNKVIILDD